MKQIAFIFISVTCLLYQQSCNRPGNMNVEQDRPVRLAPDERSGIVFFFKKEISGNDQTKFIDEVLSVKHYGVPGLDLLPGVDSSLSVRVHGYDGYAMNFTEDATEAQKLEVKRRLDESPLIYKVYRNVVPRDINDL